MVERGPAWSGVVAARGAGRERSVRRRYRFGLTAWIYAFIALLVALGAVNSQNNLLYWGFGLALAVMMISGVISGQMLMGVRVERERVGAAQVGVPMRLVYRVWNRGRLVPAFALSIEEMEPPGGGAGDRVWIEHLPRPRGFVAHVARRKSAVVRVTVVPTRRGLVRLVGVRVRSGFPFGLIGKIVERTQRCEIVVRPRLLVPRVDLLARSWGMGTTGAPTRRAGSGDEFFALREYVTGDNWRSIAWKSSARTGNLLVRQSSAPAPPRVMVVLRVGPGASDEQIERCVSGAAGLVTQAAARGMAVGLSVPALGLSERPRTFAGSGGGGGGEALLDRLSLLDFSEVRGQVEGAAGPGRFPLTPIEAGVRTVVVTAGDIGPGPHGTSMVQVSADDDRAWSTPSPERARAAQTPVAGAR